MSEGEKLQRERERESERKSERKQQREKESNKERGKTETKRERVRETDVTKRDGIDNGRDECNTHQPGASPSSAG